MNRDSMRSGVVFGVIMGVFYYFQSSLLKGIISGVIGGILFGFLMGVFIKKIKKPKITLDKEILFEGRANHFKGIEGVGGWLFLTNDELIFKSHSINIQKHELVIPKNEIMTVKPVKTIGLFSNGLKVTTNKQKHERFVVNNQKIWMKNINEIINKQ